jgi:hypothetical protein
MTAAILQLEHHSGKAFMRNLILPLFFPGLRDLIILAVNTPKVAVSKKDISRSPSAGQAWFLAKMCAV